MLTCMFEKENFKTMTRADLEPMYALAVKSISSLTAI